MDINKSNDLKKDNDLSYWIFYFWCFYVSLLSRFVELKLL